LDILDVLDVEPKIPWDFHMLSLENVHPATNLGPLGWLELSPRPGWTPRGDPGASMVVPSFAKKYGDNMDVI